TSIAGKNRNGRRTIVFILVVREVKPRKARQPEPRQNLVSQLNIGYRLVGSTSPQFLINALHNIIPKQVGIGIRRKTTIFIVYGKVGPGQVSGYEGAIYIIASINRTIGHLP